MPVLRKRKFAPCGCCGAVIPRDDMHSLNVKVYDPDDRNEVKIPIRTCGDCRRKMVSDFEAMRWSNGKMFVRDDALQDETAEKVG